MAATPERVHWRGVHHLALVTADMDATVRFWHGVLDARLVATLAVADERLFADPDPVPAVRELREGGRLHHTAATKLVDGIIEDLRREGVTLEP
ncbi:VOC family protein [Nonomuraea sp. B1E8]|uniref:VOC family protein n=1 Tax=unclassified Nonomuraea TaxID=2593643 RepID=UPI00325DA769